MTKTASITITIDLDDTLTVSTTAAEGGSQSERIYAERLAMGIRALVLTDDQAILKAAKIYELAKNDISPAPSTTTAIRRSLRECELDALMVADQDPADPIH